MSAREQRAREVAASFWDRFDTVSHREYATAIRRGERDDCEAVQIALLAADAGPGWRVVPETPTKEMREAADGLMLSNDKYHARGIAHDVWTALLSAAPAPDAKETING